MKNMLKKRFLVIAAMSALLLMTGCLNLKDFKILSFKAEQIVPQGFKSLKGVATVEYSNPSSSFDVYDIEGAVYCKGSLFGTFTVDPLSVQGKGTSSCTVSGVFSITSPVSSVIQVISMLTGGFNVNDYTIDISAKVKPKGGVAKDVGLKGVPAGKVTGVIKSASK
ncbi:MAG: hypothetical protein ACI395_08010 [Candidatus Cryptobacteroides sp.]